MRALLFIPLFALQMAYSLSAFASFDLVGSHPEARAWYPSSGDDRHGREIADLQAYAGRIYVGFGRDDIEPSVGWRDLPIRYFNQSNALSSNQGGLGSQEISIFEVMNGLLFVPAEDREGDDYAVCTSISCSGKNFTGAESGHHIYAATEYNGNLYMAGSSGSTSCTATVWRSTNSGSTWSVVRRMYKTNSHKGCARFTLLSVLNGKLYVQGYQYDWSPLNQAPCYSTDPDHLTCNWTSVPQVHILNGNSWSVSNNSIVSGVQKKPDGKEFAGKMVFLEYDRTLKSFNGSTTTIVKQFVRDYTISNGLLYVLMHNGAVERTTNLENWSTVDTSFSSSRSIEVLNDVVYVGTNQGQIFKSTVLVPCTDCTVVAPVLYLLLLSDEENP